MRKVTYGAACSLDGFIAAADGGVDWLYFSKDVQAIMADYWRQRLSSRSRSGWHL